MGQTLRIGRVFGVELRVDSSWFIVFVLIAWSLAGWLAQINLILGLFNLIPGFPLDGGRVLRAVVWGATGSPRRAAAVAIGAGRVVAFGLIFLGIWLIFAGNWADGLWIAFIGWFLDSAASAQQSPGDHLTSPRRPHLARRWVPTAHPFSPV